MVCHTSIDSNSGIIFDIQIDMFLNTEPEISRVTEIGLLQLIFFDFETTFKNFFSLKPLTILGIVK